MNIGIYFLIYIIRLNWIYPCRYINRKMNILINIYYGFLIIDINEFWQHRYYGKSVPFGSSKEALRNASSLGYFNSAQAIADYADVIMHVKKKYSANTSPVIVIGGSYGGSKWSIILSFFYIFPPSTLTFYKLFYLKLSAKWVSKLVAACRLANECNVFIALFLGLALFYKHIYLGL